MSDPKKFVDLKVGDDDPTGAGKIDTIVIQADGLIVYLEQDYGISYATEEPLQNSQKISVKLAIGC